MLNSKVRDTLRLRSWKDFLSLRLNAGEPIEYWVHVASAGELEYAIPIFRELEKRKKRVLVTYYSISAKKPVEQLQHVFSNVSLVVPLPHDGLGLMKEFVSLVRKQGVGRLLLMKYELWPGLLWECNAQGVKVVLVDALKPSWFHRRLLHKLDGILSGYKSEVETLNHAFVKVVGDTRVERVIERVGAGEKKLREIIPGGLRAILASKPVLVCGSMWRGDNRLVLSALEQYRKTGGACNVIWVPHEIDESECNEMTKKFKSIGYRTVSFDDVESASKVLSDEPVAVIVKKKGVLAELYRLGQFAFVGGGFGSGVHSVWEPALAGAFVACGPKTMRSPESRELCSRGVLTRVETPSQFLELIFKYLNKQEPINKVNLDELLEKHLGASKRIVEMCELI